MPTAPGAVPLSGTALPSGAVLPAGTVLLSGIVGSTAYGFAHAGSDLDRLGLFATPTEELHGLHRPAESHVTTAPDVTLHEAAKWCRLALSCNPTASELVWLPEDLYETVTPLGRELVGIRSSFLSAPAVRRAYLGYADQQFRKLLTRDTTDPATRRRAAKHARHLVRACFRQVFQHNPVALELEVDGRMIREQIDPLRCLAIAAQGHFPALGPNPVPKIDGLSVQGAGGSAHPVASIGLAEPAAPAGLLQAICRLAVALQPLAHFCQRFHRILGHRAVGGRANVEQQVAAAV